jgi:hypothetical protein
VSLLAKFEALDGQLKHALAAESSPLLLSLAALEIADREAGVQRLTAEHMVACLEAAGIAVKRMSVSRHLPEPPIGFLPHKNHQGTPHID